VRYVSKLLGEHLLQRASGRKQAVAHQDGLQAVADHDAVAQKIVEVIGLLCLR
jgi:hypothetical protein